MKKNKLIYILGVAIVLFMASCTDTLTEEPDSYYEKKNYFVSVSNAQMAVTGILDVLAKQEHYGQYEMAMPSSDDTYYINGTNSDNTRRDISHYTIRPENQWIYQIWMYKYQGVDRANFAIDGIMSMADYETSKQLQELVAQARFLRALLAFDLVKYWGDVPFKTEYSTSYQDGQHPRRDREEIYDIIVDDLNFAKENMPWATASSSPERPTQGAARALLMRVLLQRAGYSLKMDGTITRPDDAKRVQYFDAVVKEWEAFKSNGYHGFYNGYVNLFKSFSGCILDSKESIFEIAFYNPSGSKEDSGVWGTWNGPAVDAPGANANFMGRANAFFRVVPEWKGFFEDQDERRDVMVCTYKYAWDKTLYNHVKKEEKNSKNWYPGKWRREWMALGYKDPNNTDVNYSFLRYADVVLMAAEAYNELNQTSTAWSLLNSVRERSGATAITIGNYATLMKAPKVYNLSYIDDSSDAGKFRTALYWERAFELAFEGQRKYDLIRWGIIKEALTKFRSEIKNPDIYDVENNVDLYPAGKNFTSGKHELFPIPLDEIQLNRALEGKNNPKY